MSHEMKGLECEEARTIAFNKMLEYKKSHHLKNYYGFDKHLY